MSSAKQISNGSPALRILLPFCTGILLVEFNIINDIGIYAVSILISLIILYCPLIYNWRHPTYFLLILLSSALYCNLQLTNENLFSFKSEIRKISATQVMIHACSKVGVKYTRYDASVEYIRMYDGWRRSSGNVSLYKKNDQDFTLYPGDRIISTDILHEISRPQNPGELDYRKIMMRKGCYANLFLKNYVSINGGSLFDRMQHLPENIRLSLSDNIRSQFSRDHAAILAALLLGDKAHLNDELKSSFARSGIMHILCVSGLHVGLIYLILAKIFITIPHLSSKWIKTIFLLTGIWSFACVTGLGPSVCRAALMISLYELSKLSQRETSSWNIVFVSALILLIIDPHNLFNVGFQLSYAAVAGILLIYVPLNKFYKEVPVLAAKMLDIVMISCAAQLSTLPFVIYYFNEFPVLFLLANIIALPVATVSIYLGIANLIVNGQLSSVLFYPLDILIFLSDSVEELSGSYLQNLNFQIGDVIFYYLIFFSLLFFLKYKDVKTVHCLFVILICYCSYNLFTQVNPKIRSELVIYKVKESTVIDVFEQEHLLSFKGASPTEVSNFKYETSAKRREADCKQTEELLLQPYKDDLLKLYDEIYYLQRNLLEEDSLSIDSKVSVLVVGTTNYLDPVTIIKQLQPKLLVLDASIPRYKARKIAFHFRRAGVRTYVVSDNGAFVLQSAQVK